MATERDLLLARGWLARPAGGRTERSLVALLRRVRSEEERSRERDVERLAGALETIAHNGGDCPLSRPPLPDLCPRITRADQAVARAALARVRARRSRGV